MDGRITELVRIRLRQLLDNGSLAMMGGDEDCDDGEVILDEQRRVLHALLLLKYRPSLLTCQGTGTGKVNMTR